MTTQTPGLSAPLPDSGYPYSPRTVLDWLTQRLAADLPGERVFVEAAVEVVKVVVADELPSWGPRPGSKAEGEYEKAFEVFYALEETVRPLMLAGGVER